MARAPQLVGDGAERLREAEALLAASTTVNSPLDMPEALRLICRELARLLGADTAAACRHDGTSDHLVPRRRESRPQGVVRLTMEQLGGQVAYVSEEGKVSTFVVTPPIAA